MVQPPKKINTKRLYLRKPVIEDAVPIFEKYAQEQEITKYLTWQPHKSIKETKEFLQRCAKVWQEGTAFPWVIIRRSDDELLGMIEITGFDHTGANLGYVLAKQYWGKSYTTEAVRAIIEWCLKQKEIYRVWAFCDIKNSPSGRVLEKAGMQKEGTLRRWIILPCFGDIPRDCICYSIVK